ncbi:class I tRNA ligase family protein, partial [Staphylococcus aureus]|uniref:class I tRNA ligase family protein n=1 Tax=Staphylococcus aureus TaxID=1280 RepID=UPI0037DA5CD0
MTKSLPNRLHPIHLIHQYPPHTFPYFLPTPSSPPHHLTYSTQKLQSLCNFINKISNPPPFTLINIPQHFKLEDIHLTPNLSLPHKSILTPLNQTIPTLTHLTHKYQFPQLPPPLYNFISHHFSHSYIQITKIPINTNHQQQKQLTPSLFTYTLHNIITILHPFIPFLT